MIVLLQAGRMLKFIRGKGQQPSAERQKLQNELFAFRKVCTYWEKNRSFVIITVDSSFNPCFVFSSIAGSSFTIICSLKNLDNKGSYEERKLYKCVNATFTLILSQLQTLYS